MMKVSKRFELFMLIPLLMIFMGGGGNNVWAQNQNTSDTSCIKPNPGFDNRIKENLAGFQDSNLCSGGIPKYSKLCESVNGKLYGLTCYGGEFNAGVLFEFNPDSRECYTRVDFDTASMGCNPYGSLMQASNKKLYGMARSGGKYGKGVLFEYDPFAPKFRKLIDFKGLNGSCPYGGLVEGSGGILYGLTTKGGHYNAGVLFEYSLLQNEITKAVDFKEEETGSYPHGNLVMAPDGKLYGMTREGGKYGYGTLFEYDPGKGSLQKLFDFNGTETGCFPRGELIPDGSNLLYGLTASGGKSKFGVLFSFDISKGKYQKIMDFTDKPSGICPLGSLLMTEKHHLLGMTYQGGENGFGVLFEFDPVNSAYSKKIDFNGMNGKYPFGSLIQSTNKKIYGMTQFGGISGGGVLFEYNPESGQMTKIFDFRGYNYRTGSR